MATADELKKNKHMEKRRFETMKTRFLIFTLALIILTSMVACGSNNNIPEQKTDLVVSADFKPSISVPYCDQARKAGKINGNTYLCMVSANGDYVGEGKSYLYQSPDMTFSSGPALILGALPQAVISVRNPKLDDSWNLYFEPPFNKPWVVGNLYENPITSVSGGTTGPGLSISGNHKGCSTVDGKFEILEVVVDKSDPRQLAKFSANFEQYCDGASGALTGYIRYNATVIP
jgi:hypothetical protein